MAPCPICGFDSRGLAPADGVAALRSFPRRFGELVQDDDPDREAKLAIAGREAAAAATEIALAGEELRRVLVSDEPSLDGGVPVTKSELGEAATSVADLAASAHGSQWQRTGRRGSETVTALELLAEAVHAGAHHLKLAEQAL